MRVSLVLITIASVVRGAARERDTLAGDIKLYPKNDQYNVSPDIHLQLTFSSPPSIGTSGRINVYDSKDMKLVDTLDLSIPSSPSLYVNGSTEANYTDTTKYQTNIIGGLDFYFYPIIVRGNTSTIYLHNNKLTYGNTYLVEIEPGVLKTAEGSFSGFTRDKPWKFTTKRHGPRSGITKVLVAQDGSGDFNTIQGAIDWAPADPPKLITINVRDGYYEEIVFCQYKSNLFIHGESYGITTVGYPNNVAFNPPNRPGPSRSAVFSFRGCSDLEISRFTINNSLPGQAEALIVDGKRIILDWMKVNGGVNAFTTYGTVYVHNSNITGKGDAILGYGSVYWQHSRIESTGAITWTRTVQGIHGNVFVNSFLIGLEGNSTLARLPENSGEGMDNWPYAEMVLIDTRTSGITPEGWGPVQGPPFDSSHVRFWEYNTMDLQGQPINMSQRLNISRQLKPIRDHKYLLEYQDPAKILGGWHPTVIYP
ncbi:pectinesterase [Xylaria digitata]|nr:pectinesterase [Xylaria digitata]